MYKYKFVWTAKVKRGDNLFAITNKMELKIS